RFDCDWSSDVCSSDLNPRAAERNQDVSHHSAPRPVATRAIFSRRQCGYSLGCGRSLRLVPEPATYASAEGGPHRVFEVPLNLFKIGRASCRERVCTWW